MTKKLKKKQPSHYMMDSWLMIDDFMYGEMWEGKTLAEYKSQLYRLCEISHQLYQNNKTVVNLLGSDTLNQALMQYSSLQQATLNDIQLTIKNVKRYHYNGKVTRDSASDTIHKYISRIISNQERFNYQYNRIKRGQAV